MTVCYVGSDLLSQQQSVHVDHCRPSAAAVLIIYEVILNEVALTGSNVVLIGQLWAPINMADAVFHHR